jgi:HAD superfamily hydrolase (TIGR01450 family)
MSAVRRIEAVVFDVDGTLLHTHDPNSVRGATAIPGAVEAVERVRSSGRPVLFFTNGTGRPPADYAADLRTVGFALTDEEFMNPAVVAARWIERRHPGKTVLVLGAPGVVAPLKERGIAVIEGSEPRVADVVLVGWDQVLTYDALRAACDSVWAGAPLLATSTARTFSVNGGPAPGWSGAVVAGIRQTTGRRALTLGKPSPAALQEMSARARGTGDSHRRRRRRPHARDRHGSPRRRGRGPRAHRHLERGRGTELHARTSTRCDPAGRLVLSGAPFGGEPGVVLSVPLAGMTFC